MAKLMLFAARFHPVVMIAINALVITTMFVADIVAFRPIAPVDRIGSASLISSKQCVKNILSSSHGSHSLSHVQLKSADKDDRDAVLVQNSNEGKTVDAGGSKKPNNDDKVDALLALLDSVPSNLPTSKSLTDEVLDAVKNLEKECPTSDESVLSELSGNWELLWTAQDRSSEQFLKGGLANVIINPLENQSYSNNPFLGQNPFLFAEEDSGGGRANPVLPRELQDVLERTGVLEASGGSKIAPIRSSQGIDIRRKRVRNVVNVQIKKPFSVKGSVIVDVDFKPNGADKRRVDVKFDSCRFIFNNANVDRRFPLGMFGPTGWLRTGYIDDRIRITRGHKGSVFILSRTARRRSV